MQPSCAEFIFLYSTCLSPTSVVEQFLQELCASPCERRVDSVDRVTRLADHGDHRNEPAQARPICRGILPSNPTRRLVLVEIYLSCKSTSSPLKLAERKD